MPNQEPPPIPGQPTPPVDCFPYRIWQHPKTTVAGVLICLVTITGVLTQQGISLGHAGTGTGVALIGALATALLGMLSKDN